MAPKLGTICDNASALAAVPLTTGKTVTCFSNKSLVTDCNFAVRSSPPYEVTKPSLALLTAAMMASLAGATWSLLKFRPKGAPYVRLDMFSAGDCTRDL